MGTNDLFGDADDISESEGEDGEPTKRKAIVSDDEDSDGAPKKPRRDHVLSDDDDDVKRGSDYEREQRSRSREGTPKQQVRVFFFVVVVGLAKQEADG